MNKFNGLIITLLILIGVIVIGGGYTIYQMNILQKENSKITAELEKTALKNISMNIGKDESVNFLDNKDSSISDKISASTSDTLQNNYNILQKMKAVVLQNKANTEPQIHINGETETNAPKLPTDTQFIALKIDDINVLNNKDDADISWKTNKVSDSRIVMNDIIYVSDNHNSLNHKVSIKNLNYSTSYTYQIIATVVNDEVSYFGKFNTKRLFKVNFEKSADMTCSRVIVVDTAGNPLKNTQIKIINSYNTESAGRYVPQPTSTQTDIDGKSLACLKMDDAKVINMMTGETYPNIDLQN